MSGALNSVFGGGNLFGALLSAASMFFPPLAIASSLSNLLTTTIGEAIKSAVSTLVKEFGAPKFLQDIVNTIVDKAVSANQKESSPEVDAHVEATAGEDVKDFGKDFAKDVVKNAIENMGEDSKKKKGTGSWLEALATALGNALNAQAEKVKGLADQITDANASDKPKTMTDLTTASQRLSFMMNSADQCIKTIGEALSTASRKQ